MQNKLKVYSTSRSHVQNLLWLEYTHDVEEADVIIVVNDCEVAKYQYLLVTILNTHNDHKQYMSEIENALFVESQVKFRYGKWYNQLKEGNNCFDKETMTNKRRSNVIYCESSKKYIAIDDGYAHFARAQELAGVLNVYKRGKDGTNNKNFECYADLEDLRSDNDAQFHITHNRHYNSSKLILWPLQRYHHPGIFQCLLRKGVCKISFKDKLNRAVWRGQLSGKLCQERAHRAIFLDNTFEKYKDIDVALGSWIPHLHDKFMDDKKYLKNFMTVQEQCNYKFVINLEGHDWSSSFIWALFSTSCPLHTFPFQSENILFGNGLKEWVHFIPIEVDGSDLLTKYQWCLNNMDKCEEIANNGRIYMTRYANANIYHKILIRFLELWPCKGGKNKC